MLFSRHVLSSRTHSIHGPFAIKAYLIARAQVAQPSRLKRVNRSYNIYIYIFIYPTGILSRQFARLNRLFFHRVHFVCVWTVDAAMASFNSMKTTNFNCFCALLDYTHRKFQLFPQFYRTQLKRTSTRTVFARRINQSKSEIVHNYLCDFNIFPINLRAQQQAI